MVILTFTFGTMVGMMLPILGAPVHVSTALMFRIERPGCTIAKRMRPDRLGVSVG